MSIRDQIIQLVRGKDLAQAEAAEAMEEIMTGAATPAQIAAFLTALHLKGETDAEIAGMAQVMREKATPVHFEGAVLDTCGTGGDASGTFNISTTAAFVAAGNGAGEPTSLAYSGGTAENQPSALREVVATSGTTPSDVAAAGATAPGNGEVVETVVKGEHDDIGRNDPCWCGSGKKFKKCHGA